MPLHSPESIANEFIKLSGKDVVNQMWLQKLVYLAHGWNLVINNDPLVDTEPQAWDGGPVFRSIRNYIRDYGQNKLLKIPTTKKPYTSNITEKEKDVINHVWKKYGSRTGYELSQMTHMPNTPWSETYASKGRNSIINNDIIREHFVELAKAGRKQQPLAN